MTELLTRPVRTTSYDDSTPRSVWVRGAFAAAWAVAVGVASLLVVVLLAWATDSRAGSSAGTAVRAALQIWLVAHRVPLHMSGGTVAVAPLLLTLGLAALVARAAAVIARAEDVTDGSGVARVAVAVGLPYAALSAFVAAAANSPSVRPSPVAALGLGLTLGCLAATWGAARGAQLVRVLWQRLPRRLRPALDAALAATGVLLAGSTLVLLAALAIHGSTATHAVQSLGGGAVGSAVLVALDVALVPNAAVYVLGYLSGPGFAVGAGSTVTLTSSHVSALPALPLLAAVPHGPASIVVELAGLVVLVAAGAAAGWRVARVGDRLLATMATAVGAGAATGAVTAVLAALSGGPAGPGRMAVVGVSPWQLGLVVAAEVAVVATGVGAMLSWRRGR